MNRYAMEGIRVGSKCRRSLAKAAAFAAITLGLISAQAFAAAPKNTSAPSVGGTFEVGSWITVDHGQWSGDHPITFAYKYQACNSSGGSCAVAPGLFANGPRAELLLLAATAGKRIKVTVTATNPSGKKAITTQLTPVIAAYPATAGPLVEFINGVPDPNEPSYSDDTTFQFQATGTGVSLKCQIDSKAATTCPASGKVSYANLTPGSHTVKVTATNTFGSALASDTWNVEPLPLPLPCVRDDGSSCYNPPVGTTWQWQLNPDAKSTTINTSVLADMFDIDGYDNSASVIATLKALPGDHVSSRSTTCYITAGTLENWRADSEALNPEVLGNPYTGFTDERWIDVRQISQIRPWLEAKMDMCKAKGFDAIEFDNVDGWQPSNKTGLNITAADEIAFIVYLANSAHARGMTMAHKSNVEQVPAVLPYVDFAVVEECFAYKECTRADKNTDGQYGYDDFINAGKPVFEVEYKKYNPSNNVCAKANALGFSSMYKHVALDSYRVPCWATP
ncbi:MAG TPA: endo alpha-1,4 polygalactosaminidase [Terriglobales bacterium]|nr:endo alpha-1,4 polygalactosaminidase [Terriglobales bacterium]